MFNSRGRPSMVMFIKSCHVGCSLSDIFTPYLVKSVEGIFGHRGCWVIHVPLQAVVVTVEGCSVSQSSTLSDVLLRNRTYSTKPESPPRYLFQSYICENIQTAAGTGLFLVADVPQIQQFRIFNRTIPSACKQWYSYTCTIDV